MISEAELQVLADLKSILYGLGSKKFGIELCVELKYFEDCCFKISMDPCVGLFLCIVSEVLMLVYGCVPRVVLVYCIRSVNVGLWMRPQGKPGMFEGRDLSRPYRPNVGSSAFR
nr:hypothetical protein [Tanacetum cinerariifolium]